MKSKIDEGQSTDETFSVSPVVGAGMVARDWARLEKTGGHSGPPLRWLDSKQFTGTLRSVSEMGETFKCENVKN
jgi:hypothetical protein